MSKKKIVVPDGMLAVATAACEKWSGIRESQLAQKVLESALAWLAKNPISPTPEQAIAIAKSRFDDRVTGIWFATGAVEWQRRMFLAPEPEVPEEIKDLMDRWGNRFDEAILQAYRRGLAAKEKK